MDLSAVISPTNAKQQTQVGKNLLQPNTTTEDSFTPPAQQFMQPKTNPAVEIPLNSAKAAS